jgi:surface antigen
LLLRWLSIALGGWGLVILLCCPAIARTSHDVHGGNCVAYAREVTGVHLDGNAATWWPHAEGRYERGHKPQIGAILVFKPYGRMHVGHVAVVSRIVNSHEVLVDQANWVRGRVTKAISVIDTSPTNDWTSVKVEYAGTHGRDNPTYGFIYPHGPSANFSEALAAAEPDKPHTSHADRVVARTRHYKGAPDEEAAAYANLAPRHVAAHAKHHTAVDEQEAAMQPDPTPQHIAGHAAHHKIHPAPDEAKADLSAPPVEQLAAATPTHHKHKAPDARLAYVY